MTLKALLQRCSILAIWTSVAAFASVANAGVLLLPHDSDVLLLRGFDGNPASNAGFAFDDNFLPDNTVVPGQELLLGSNQNYPFAATLNRTVTFAAPVPGLRDAIVNLTEPIAGGTSDVLGMKITSVDATQTHFGVQFSFWSGDPSLTKDQFINQLNLVNPRTFTMDETGAAQNVTALLLPGAVLPTSNLSQVVLASDVAGQLNPINGDIVGGDGTRGFGAPFISDATEFLTKSRPTALFSGDDTPPPGGLLADPRKPFFTLGTANNPFIPMGLPPGVTIPPATVIKFIESAEAGQITGDPESGAVPGLSDILVMKSTATQINFYFWSENPNVDSPAFLKDLGIDNTPFQTFDEFQHLPVLDTLFQHHIPSNLGFDVIQNKSDPPVPEPGSVVFWTWLSVCVGWHARRHWQRPGFRATPRPRC